MRRAQGHIDGEQVAAYIQQNTRIGDIILDPNCGGGLIAGEALSLDRKVVAIGQKPLDAFITRTVLTPISLPRLQWAFADIQDACRQLVSELYTTTCRRCGEQASVDFVEREGDHPVILKYTCSCFQLPILFAPPDRADMRLEAKSAKMEIPYWYPEEAGLNGLFTRRSLSVLSTLLHAIESITHERVRNVMLLAFVQALDLCRILPPPDPPFMRHNNATQRKGQHGKNSATPPETRELNPFLAFSHVFNQVYALKTESNATLPHVAFAADYAELKSGTANVLLLEGACAELLRGLPDGAVDYVLTADLPDAAPNNASSAFQDAWLRDLIGDQQPSSTKTSKNATDAIAAELHRVNKPGHCQHVLNELLENDAKPTSMTQVINQLTAHGQKLGYAIEPSTKNKVVWTKSDALRLTFTLSSQQAVVNASLYTQPKVRALLGTIDYDGLGRLLQMSPASPRTSATDAAETVQAGSEMRSLQLRVINNTQVCRDHYLLRLRLPENSDVSPQPGQFLHVICDPDNIRGEENALTLRRPFSIHSITYDDFDRRLIARVDDIPPQLRHGLARQASELSILYKVIGEGTHYLTKMKPGQTLDTLGPCGHGFDIGPEAHAVIVSGGIGAAPLVALAEYLRYHNRRVYLYLGALSREFLAPALCRPEQIVEPAYQDDPPEFRQLIARECVEIGVDMHDVHICTDDGSEGEQGFVTEVLERHFRSGQLPASNVCVYTCGPHGMLRAVAAITERYAVKCQVSMEQRMACGVGACMACTCSTVAPHGKEKKRVCKDGPVFDAREIQW